MKSLNTFGLIVTLCATLLFSCEKGIDTVKTESIIYLPQSGLSVQTALLGNSVYQLGIYHAGINLSDGDLKAKIELDPAAGSDFIALNPGFEVMPTDYYQLPVNEIVLAKGNERAWFPIQLKNITESYVNKKYILPLTITSVDKGAIIHATRKTVLLQFSRFRNAYETDYKVYGKALQSGTTTGDQIKLDEVITSTSINASTIQIKGAVTGLNLLLTVQPNNQVVVTGAPGSEAFNVTPTAGQTSTYTGVFDQNHQTNVGTFNLFYTYTSGGKQMDTSVQVKFWF